MNEKIENKQLNNGNFEVGNDLSEYKSGDSMDWSDMETAGSLSEADSIPGDIQGISNSNGAALLYSSDLSNSSVENSEENSDDIISLSDARIVPTSQYGWSSDYVMPEEYQYFILLGDKICIFNGTVTVNEAHTKLYFVGYGYYQNKTYYRGEWSENKTIVFDEPINLSNTDIYNGEQIYFEANFSFSTTEEPSPSPGPEEPTPSPSPSPSEPGEIISVDLSPVISALDTLVLGQNIILFLIFFIWAEKKIRIAVSNFTGH